MTVGIAATGPRAGAGILAGLRALEAVGRGAIGGFVSLAAITAEGALLRFETQENGVQGLFSGALPEVLLSAPHAALMSSGPNRPPPLSQFVAASPGAGLVTGHRFPQARVDDGRALNALVLAAMENGSPPQEAIDEVIAKYPGFDAGFVALSVTGELAFRNMEPVLSRSDRGAAVQVSGDGRAKAATIHNAIHPHRILADMVNEVVLDEMSRSGQSIMTITLAEGVAVEVGPAAEIHVDRALCAVKVSHPRAEPQGGPKAFGLGERVKVVMDGRPLGWLGYEPFLTVLNGRIVDMDGKTCAELPVAAETAT